MMFHLRHLRCLRLHSESARMLIAKIGQLCPLQFVDTIEKGKYKKLKKILGQGCDPAGRKMH